jgi:hypothetical protein
MPYQQNLSPQPISGDTLTTTTPSTGYYLGLNSINALPSPATNLNLTGVSSDKFGRIITIPQGPRDIVYSLNTQISSTTSPITVLPAQGAGTFTDIVSVMFTNTSGFGTEIGLTNNTINYYWYVPKGDCRGSVFNIPLGTTANTAWTASCWTAVNSIWVTVQYVLNK